MSDVASEDLDHQQQMLSVLRQRLQHRELQEAQQGLSTPPEVVNEISELRKRIQIHEVEINRLQVNTNNKQNQSISSQQNKEVIGSYLHDNYLSRYICDLLETFSSGIAGIDRYLRSNEELSKWQNNLLGMLHDYFISRQVDIYVAWLRPTENHPRKLKVFKSHNMPSDYSHYEFHLGEGLAGKVWSTQTPAATSKIRQHPWWVYREGCFNLSYICVPVGSTEGSGGVLGIGSDAGFNVHDEDIKVVKIFASVLAITINFHVFKAS